jgi:hypothetical protein
MWPAAGELTFDVELDAIPLRGCAADHMSCWTAGDEGHRRACIWTGLPCPYGHCMECCNAANFRGRAKFQIGAALKPEQTT